MVGQGDKRDFTVDFSSIKGHKRPLSILARSIERERISHAYLFVGLEGIGKFLVAKMFAWALLCEATGKRPCMSCSQCRKVTRGNHPDLVVMGPIQGQIRIGQIREMQRMLVHAPREGMWRVVILDEANCMNPNAANAMLKVLEEPPLRNVFILVSRAVDSILPTIVSRCQVIHFSPLKADDIFDILRDGTDVSPQDAQRIALRSQGSASRAFEIAKGGGMEGSPKAKEVFDTVASVSWSECLAALSEWSADRQTALETLRILLGLVRDLVALCAGTSPLEHSFLKEEAPSLGWGMDIGRLTDTWSRLLEAVRGLEHFNWNPQLTLEQVFLQCRESIASSTRTGAGI